MSLTFQQQEKFVLVTLKAEPDSEMLEKAVQLTTGFLKKGEKNFILLVQKVEQPNSSFVAMVEKISLDATVKGGNVVVAKPNEDVADILEDMGIMFTDSLEEARDYIFMEELEQEFLDEDEEDEELLY
ncbi:MAG: hypothetical protein WD077_13115 [Bacteroidia bacterium]